MDMIPVASFLAGSLLTILMPTLLLISIVVWYHLEVRRYPEPRHRPGSPGSTTPRTSSPGSTTPGTSSPGSTTPRTSSPGSTTGGPTADRPPGSPSSGA